MSNELAYQIMGTGVCVIAFGAILQLMSLKNRRGSKLWLDIATLICILWYALIIWNILP